MKLRNQVSLARVIATCAASCMACVAPLAVRPPVAQAAGEAIHLRAGLPTPWVITEAPKKQVATSLEIRGELDGDGDGWGTVTLGEGPLEFNPFGDENRTSTKIAERRRVRLRRVTQQELDESKKELLSKLPPRRVPPEQRRLYEVVFEDAFPVQVFLVLSDGTHPHRLTIYDADQKVPGLRSSPTRILNLHGVPAVDMPVADTPFNNSLDLVTYAPISKGTGLRQISVRGKGNPRDSVRLHFDINTIGFNEFGDQTSTTLMGGGTVIESTLHQIDVTDPQKKLRRLFEIIPNRGDRTTKYFLVLSPTGGANRLLIKERGQLQHILPLQNSRRRLRMLARLEELSATEQQAMADLTETIDYGFDFQVESGAVVQLDVQTAGDSHHVDPMLKQLTNLRRISFSRTRLTAVGLPSLGSLAKLESIVFSGSSIDDNGLASVKDLAGLETLIFDGCQGITDRGVAHFEKLKNLRVLHICRDDTLHGENPSAEVITDVGMKHLAGLRRLEDLTLTGQTISDAGLRHLKALTNLKRLSLSGGDISDAGFEHLTGLVRLESLSVSETSLTPAGVEAFRSKMPSRLRELDVHGTWGFWHAQKAP